MEGKMVAFHDLERAKNHGARNEEQRPPIYLCRSFREITDSRSDAFPMPPDSSKPIVTDDLLVSRDRIIDVGPLPGERPVFESLVRATTIVPASLRVSGVFLSL